MSPKQRSYLFALIFLIPALAACASPPVSPAETPAFTAAESAPAATPTATPADESLMPHSTFSSDMQKIADQAVAILSQSLNISPDAVTILSIQRVQWSNAALGCPKPGMMYAQVITPGYLVKAEVHGEIHQVHMNDRGHGVVCPPDRARKPIRIDDSSQ